MFLNFTDTEQDVEAEVGDNYVESDPDKIDELFPIPQPVDPNVISPSTTRSRPPPVPVSLSSFLGIEDEMVVPPFTKKVLNQDPLPLLEGIHWIPNFDGYVEGFFFC